MKKLKNKMKKKTKIFLEKLPSLFIKFLQPPGGIR